ncbi:SDR family oxidoreductase [Tessaracoccus rhinocerotis]|uniref:SDR family oxidoreductase n=1 Tax=Tessaracoccus rhinocerotis TaxID=1689449 RepID=A0A553K0D8_9ACTN|nr:NAD(P)-binding oxidoreductase [Tessaracoccus rhinocerotis]TRY18159.1 SDR family oxidoreductase [Tessaracoccus rhinocerotis]
MRIIIIGGHGQVALLAAPLLVGVGHQVTSVIRSEEQVADVEATGATALVADIESLGRDAIGGLVRGHDAVVWSAGAGGGNPQRTYAVDRDAAIRTIDAAQAEGADRFIMVSYAGAGRDDVPQDSSFRPYAEAKADADGHLRRSELVWTILGPGRLTLEEGSNHIEFGNHVTGGDTSRANVAQMILATVGRTDLAGTKIDFRDGNIAIDEAVEMMARELAGDPVSHVREGFPKPFPEPPVPDDLTGR